MKITHTITLQEGQKPTESISVTVHSADAHTAELLLKEAHELPLVRHFIETAKQHLNGKSLCSEVAGGQLPQSQPLQQPDQRRHQQQQLLQPVR